MRLVIANSYPTRAHGIIVKYDFVLLWGNYCKTQMVPQVYHKMWFCHIMQPKMSCFVRVESCDFQPSFRGVGHVFSNNHIWNALTPCTFWPVPNKNQFSPMLPSASSLSPPPPRNWKPASLHFDLHKLGWLPVKYYLKLTPRENAESNLIRQTYLFWNRRMNGATFAAIKFDSNQLVRL